MNYAMSTAAPRLAAARRCFGAGAPAAAAAAAARPRYAAAMMVRASTSSSSPSATTTTKASPPPAWDIRMLYDGACPLCMKEVTILKRRDAARGKIDFVDISAPDYSAADNAGISYATAMERIHAIERDGTVVTGVAVFRRLYEAVGLGWVYAATKNKAVETAANAVYEIWAKYRTQLTGREALEVLLARRAAEAAGDGDRTSLCGGPGDEGACEVGVGGARADQQQ